MPASPRMITGAVMGALVVWGTVLAIGAWRRSGQVASGLIVIGCVAGFLAFWGAALAVRAGRTRDRDGE